MELRHLRYFVAVAEELHFGRAADRLHMAQPPLSLQIRALEEEIGARLLERTNRRVALTDAGRDFLQRSRAILEAATEAKYRAARVARGAAGRLEIGFTGSAPFNDVMVPLLTRFRRRWPEVSLSMQQMTSATQFEALRDGVLDIGFARFTSDLPPVGIAAHRVLREPLLVALSSDHRLAGRGRIAMSELKDEAFVIPTRAAGPGSHDKAWELCSRAGFSPRVVSEGRQVTTSLTLAAAGIGVSVVVAGMRNTGIAGLAFVEIDDERAFIDLAVTHREGETAATVRNFLSLLDLGWRRDGVQPPGSAGSERRTSS